MANQIRIGVGVTGAKQAATQVDQLKDKFAKLQSQSAKGFVTGTAAGLGLGAFNLATTAIRGVTGALGDAKDAYIAEERSIAGLNTALRANIVGWDGSTRAIETVLQARMKLGFSDDEQRASLARLVAATGDVNKALAIQSTAMDLARFKNISLAEATDALTKVEAGSFRILKSLGIELREGATQTEALAAVQKIAAGQAESYAQTLEGKLLVAEVKAGEASEKFGKQIARLSAEVLPAAADALGRFADGIDGIQLALDDTVTPLEKVDTAIRVLTESDHANTIAGRALMESLLDQQAALAGTSSMAGKLADDVVTLGDAAGAAEQPTDDLGDEVDELADAAADAEREIDDLADTISDDLFGDAINAGNIAQLQKTYKELLKQRDGAKEGSREYKILTGRIAENRQELFELHLTQAEKKGPQAAIEFLRKEKQRAGDTTGALQALIEKYRKLAGMQGTLGPIIVPHSRADQERRRASGGPVTAGKAYTVGEQGPETFVAPENGTIIPNGGGGGGSAWSGGGTLTVNVNIAGGVMTPGGAQQVMQQLGPHIASYLKGRGFRTA